MFTTARIILALALAAVAAAVVFQVTSATGPAAGAQPVDEPKGPQRAGESPAVASKTAMTPEERFERLVEGVIDLAIEEVGEQMRGQEAADAETRRQCDQRREAVRRKRRAMYVVHSQEKER